MNWHKFFTAYGMENNEKQLQEQKAPLKNHDDAFVQVGKNGEPVIPQGEEGEKEEAGKEDTATGTGKQ